MTGISNMTETTKMKSKLRITDADLLPFRIISQIIKSHYLNHINSLSNIYLVFQC